MYCSHTDIPYHEKYTGNNTVYNTGNNTVYNTGNNTAYNAFTKLAITVIKLKRRTYNAQIPHNYTNQWYTSIQNIWKLTNIFNVIIQYIYNIGNNTV